MKYNNQIPIVQVPMFAHQFSCSINICLVFIFSSHCLISLEWFSCSKRLNIMQPYSNLQSVLNIWIMAVREKLLSSSWPWPWPTWSLTWPTWSPTWANKALVNLVINPTKPCPDKTWARSRDYNQTGHHPTTKLLKGRNFLLFDNSEFQRDN